MNTFRKSLFVVAALLGLNEVQAQIPNFPQFDIECTDADVHDWAPSYGQMKLVNQGNVSRAVVLGGGDGSANLDIVVRRKAVIQSFKWNTSADTKWFSDTHASTVEIEADFQSGRWALAGPEADIAGNRLWWGSNLRNKYLDTSLSDRNLNIAVGTTFAHGIRPGVTYWSYVEIFGSSPFVAYDSNQKVNMWVQRGRRFPNNCWFNSTDNLCVYGCDRKGFFVGPQNISVPAQLNEFSCASYVRSKGSNNHRMTSC